MANSRFAILQAVAISDQRISNSQFRTLAALATFGDKNGWCYPSLRVLADMLHKPRQNVSRDIQALVKLGYLEVRPHYRQDGSRSSNIYRLVFDFDGLPVQDGGDQDELDGYQAERGGVSSPEEGGVITRGGGCHHERGEVSSPEEGGVITRGGAINIPINIPINTPIKLEDNDNDGAADFSRAAQIYEEEIGVLTPMVADEIDLTCREYPLAWIEAAIKEAAKNQARSWSYVAAILKNWKTHGFGWKPTKKKNGGLSNDRSSTIRMMN